MESISNTNNIESLQKQIGKLTFKNEIIYKRTKLIKLVQKEEDIECGYIFGEPIEKIYSNILSIKNLGESLISNSIAADKLEYYFYNCESVRDFGWGCAWRCIQIVIGTLRNLLLNDEKYENTLLDFHKLINFDNRFDTLFHSYGGKELLLNLFLSSYRLENIPEYILAKEFAPFETEQGWGEPFLAKLILHDFGVTGDLFLVNRYAEFSYAPQEVFNRTLSYREFRDYLVAHFKQDDKLPVIIDDTLFTICIIGATLDNDDILHLLIADPHIDNVDNAETGIYHLTLDKEGNFDAEKNTEPTINGKRFRFETGSFMVYAPFTPKPLYY